MSLMNLAQLALNILIEFVNDWTSTAAVFEFESERLPMYVMYGTLVLYRTFSLGRLWKFLF